MAEPKNAPKPKPKPKSDEDRSERADRIAEFFLGTPAQREARADALGAPRLTPRRPSNDQRFTREEDDKSKNKLAESLKSRG